MISSDNKKQKTGLLVEGGGMKCAYSAGVLDRFLDEGITFDYVIGVSAGCANSASFLGNQRDRNRRFYTDHIAEPEYFGWKPFLQSGNLFNLSYIYGTLTNSDGGDPLDYQAFQENPAEYVLVATNARTGKAEYFHKEDIPRDDYRLIMASCALPGACRPVRWQGQAYYDGGVADSIPIRRALQDGCDKVVAIMSKPHDYVKSPEGMRAAYTLLCRHYPATVHALNRRHIQYNRSQHMLYEMERKGHAFVFTPEAHTDIGTTTMDSALNQKLYDLGIQDVEHRLSELKSFLGKQK